MLGSRSRVYWALGPLASSSSTISCGLIVIWTTLGASRLNLESDTRQHAIAKTTQMIDKDAYLIKAPYLQAVFRTRSVGSS